MTGGIDELSINTDTEPDDDSDGHVYLSASVSAGGTLYGANAIIEGEPPPDEIAEGLLKTALAAAQMHSASVWIALQQRLKEAR
jgi:hypothetical protein